jgi:hypothetical protein
LWCSSLYEPYAAFEFVALWPHTAEAWHTAHAVDEGRTLLAWHAEFIRDHWQALAPAERERVEAYRQRSQGHNPIDHPHAFANTR